MTNATLYRKYTNAQSRFIFIEDALIHYRDEGEGEPLVLLHGSFASLHTFDAWVERLSKHYRVLRFDMPGFGLSDLEESAQLTIPTYVHYLRRFLNLMGIDRCFLAGSSLGGWIAWEFAVADPQRVRKLVLMDAAGYLSLDNVPLPFQMARAPFISGMMKYSIQRPLVERFVSQVYSDQRKITPELIDRYYELFAKRGNPEAFLSFAKGRFRDNTPHLRNLQVPTLIIWGEDDRWLSVQNAYRFHEDIPYSELIIYQHVGHIPMEEVPETTARDLRIFLEE